jgi:hypothetical protein
MTPKASLLRRIWIPILAFFVTAVGGFLFASAIRPGDGAFEPNGFEEGTHWDSVTTFASRMDSVAQRQFLGQRTIVLIFQESCIHCKAQVPAWRKLAQESSHSLQVVAVSIGAVSSLDTYPLFEGGEIRYMGMIRPQSIPDGVGFAAVPFTVAINSYGEVVRVAQGIVGLPLLREMARATQ